MVFEPRAPDPGVLAAQAAVLVLTGAAAAYWWLVVVPSERAALGRSKRRGPVDSYLRELETPGAEQDRRLERWFYTDWLKRREDLRQRKQQRGAAAAPSPASAAEAPPHQQASSEAGGAAAPPDPYDGRQPYNEDLLRPSVDTPTPRFFSLDNPIVATGALLLLAGLVSALQQS
ncbi:hypothetical protein GPECTOR_5g352 [Gonium pectorale]|uniref:Uncharacterized protein n=1 Tax=Gonium pectorale TaxID=33097 RepID=A0A150GWZ8_GONPE|nr:hypothetical protein GPECTOR_5g352 [Gonium pectorale]|eukprot:KXZ54263.1 hypothetical protein GPECTOR_5g352 [Gonium pectorale]